MLAEWRNRPLHPGRGSPASMSEGRRKGTSGPQTRGHSGHLLERPGDLDVARHAADAEVDPVLPPPRPGASSSGISELTAPDIVSTSTWRSTPSATPTETSPDTERTCRVPRSDGEDADVARDVDDPGPVRQLAQADVPRGRLHLDPVARRTDLEVARRRGEHGRAGHARAAQVPRRGVHPEVTAHRAQRDVAAGRLGRRRRRPRRRWRCRRSTW